MSGAKDTAQRRLRRKLAPSIYGGRLPALSDLASIVKREMDDLIQKFDLELVVIDQDEVLLRAQGYALAFIADREGATLVYFDTASSPIKGYNLWLFLINKRRERLSFGEALSDSTDVATRNEAHIIRLVLHLRAAGQDILSGSKEWMSQYFWPIADTKDTPILGNLA